MNPGVTEEASKVAQTTVDALKSTPVILAVLIFNIAWMGIIAYTTHESGERWERTVDRTIRYCIPATGSAKPPE